jgi:hypothetical protein
MRAEFFHRLRQASPGEIGYRLQRVVRTARLRHLVRGGRRPFSIPEIGRSDAARLRPPALRESGIPETGRFAYEGGFPWLEFERACQGRFVSDVPFPDPEPDIRAVWEPARLQEESRLLAGSYATRESRRLAKDRILQWIRKNPFLRGPHYLSAMECGLRILPFLLCLRKCELDSRAFRTVCDAIYEHGWWISRNLSLHASVGNHTICEGFGLVLAGALFGGTSEGRRWFQTGHDLLNREIGRQILPDGGPEEQSFAYHRMVLDLFWLARDFMARNRLPDCGNWSPRLKAGESFLAAFGPVPSVGDSDGGHAVGPGMEPERETPPPTAAKRIFFPNAGYTVVRDAGWRLVFDHGPLGMPPLYNHGHADALSILLDWRDRPFLVDPGTYRYNGVPQWRRYFKSTRAHNTVTIDGEDQAVQKTGFVWAAPYSTRLDRIENFGAFHLLRATHDGYSRLHGAVRHHRTAVFKADVGVVLYDTFSGAGKHEFEINFHLHPEVVAEENSDGYRLSFGDASLFLRSSLGRGLSVVAGSKQPIRGWHSFGYGNLTETRVLTGTQRGRAEEVTFTTWISSNPERAVPVNFPME